MKRKLIVIGIDGGTFKIIDPLIEEGKLPNLKKIVNSGVKTILKSTYPPITAAAWISFMTGKNPGKHGFYDFREYNPKDYTPSFVPGTKDAVKENVSTLHSSRYHGETIWDFLSEAGYEMNVVAVPMTYPPWKVNGRMVAGYPCPDYKKPKTYPSEWSDEIGQLFDMSAVNYSKIDGFIRECKELVKRKGRIILEQMRQKKGEVFAVVFSSTDFAQHYFWKYLQHKSHQYHSVINEIYIEVDKVIGKILDFIDDNASIVIMSDHGFMKFPSKYFYLNSWLMQEKHLFLKQNQHSAEQGVVSKAYAVVNRIVNKRADLKLAVIEKLGKMPAFVQKWVTQKHFKSGLIDWERTKAFRFRMYATVDGIVINQKGRQEKGIVEGKQDYEKLREEIMGKLLEIKDPDNGKPVIAEVFKREDIYGGDYLENAPDIIIRFNPEYMGGVELNKGLIDTIPPEISNVFTGVHDNDGIFIFSGPNSKKSSNIEPVNITDVTPTILYDMDLPIPDDIDGRIIEEAFMDSFKNRSANFISRDKKSSESKESLSKEDEESMKKALKGLGYL